MSTTAKQKQVPSFRDTCGYVEIKTPPGTGYDPLTANEGVGPLFWELLRRHPGFRFRCRQLESILNGEQLEFISTKKISSAAGRPHGAPVPICAGSAPVDAKQARLIKPRVFVSRHVFRLAISNPLAALVLAWSFRDRPFLFRWPTPESWFGASLRDIKLGRSLQVRQLTKSSPAWKKLYAAEVERAAVDTMNAQAHEAESFSLDTAWKELPIRFRAYFSWLAEEYDHRLNWVREHVYGLDGFGWWPPAGLYEPEVDWSFLNKVFDQPPGSPHPPPFLPDFKLQALADTCAAYHLFLIPKQIPSQVAVNELKHTFGKTLDSLFEANKGFAVGSNERTPYGASTDWKVLDYCRARIEYTRDGPNSPGLKSRNVSLGYGQFKSDNDAVFKDLENEMAGPGKAPSHRQSDFKKRYSRMEKEMMMTFPRFSIDSCLVDNLGLDPEAVHTFSERAHKVAGLKLYHLVVAPMNNYEGDLSCHATQQS